MATVEWTIGIYNIYFVITLLYTVLVTHLYFCLFKLEAVHAIDVTDYPNIIGDLDSAIEQFDWIMKGFNRYLEKKSIFPQVDFHLLFVSFF